VDLADDRLDLCCDRRDGQLIRDYRDGKGMPKRAKVTALLMITVAVTASAFVLDSWTLRGVVIVAGLIGLYWVGIRVPTRVDLPPPE